MVKKKEKPNKPHLCPLYHKSFTAVKFIFISEPRVQIQFQAKMIALLLLLLLMVSLGRKREGRSQWHRSKGSRFHLIKQNSTEG